ncbi:MAG: hypothetical protein K0U98_22585 [Deltaproteobacteria bacterium]|nr:hypothetical protein [Deltaproteobacteria bacterium]
MRKYSKAYYLKDLRAYDGWQEKEREDTDELTDESIVYLQDNFTVVKDVFNEEDYIFDTVDDSWKTFCKDKLGFEIPEDLRYAYEETEPANEDAEAEATESTN